jgi:hypothetical protein
MPAKLPKRVLDKHPVPGTPTGFHSRWDEILWGGIDKVRVLPINEVRVWVSTQARKAGQEPLLLRVDPSAQGGHILAVQAHSKGWDSDMLRSIRETQTRHNAEEVFRRMVKLGAVVEGSRADIVEYEIKKKTTPLWKRVWSAGLHLAALVWSVDYNGPMEFERSAGRGPGLVVTLDLEHLTACLPAAKERRAWLSDMRAAERAALAQEIELRTENRLMNPGDWRAWAGTIRQARHFVHRTDYHHKRVARPMMSFGPNLTRTCLYTLAKQWLHADSPVAKAAGVTECGQQTLFAKGML